MQSREPHMALPAALWEAGLEREGPAAQLPTPAEGSRHRGSMFHGRAGAGWPGTSSREPAGSVFRAKQAASMMVGCPDRFMDGRGSRPSATPEMPRGVLARRRRSVLTYQHRMSQTALEGAQPSGQVQPFVAHHRRPPRRLRTNSVGQVPADYQPSSVHPPPDQPPTEHQGHPSATGAEAGLRRRSVVLLTHASDDPEGSGAQSRLLQTHAKLQPGDWADMAPRGLQYQGRGAAWRQRLLGFVNSPWYYVLLVLAALFVVFADDVKRAALPPTADLPLEAVLCGVWSIIILDMAISSCIKPGYFFGFYWWLDLIAISSLAFEVPALAQRTMGVGGQPASAQDRDRLYTWVSQQALIIAQVARVARAFRLLRLLRLLTLYKRFSAKRRARAALAKAGITPGAEHGILAAQDLTLIELEILQNGNKESRVGQKLDELIIRRIIVFILICALLLPPLNPYLGVLGRGQALDVGGLKMLHDMAVAKPSLPTQIGIGGPSNGSLLIIATQTFADQLLFRVGSHNVSTLVLLVVKNSTMINSTSLVGPRRWKELYQMEYSSVIDGCLDSALCPAWVTTAVYDWHWFCQAQALLNIGQSLFVFALLTLGAWLLSRDCRVLVLQPIERMMAKVTALADNPLALQPSARVPWQDYLDRRQQQCATSYPGAQPLDSGKVGEWPGASVRPTGWCLAPDPRAPVPSWATEAQASEAHPPLLLPATTPNNHQDDLLMSSKLFSPWGGAAEAGAACGQQVPLPGLPLKAGSELSFGVDPLPGVSPTPHGCGLAASMQACDADAVGHDSDSAANSEQGSAQGWRRSKVHRGQLLLPPIPGCMEPPSIQLHPCLATGARPSMHAQLEEGQEGEEAEQHAKGVQAHQQGRLEQLPAQSQPWAMLAVEPLAAADMHADSNGGRGRFHAAVQQVEEVVGDEDEDGGRVDLLAQIHTAAPPSAAPAPALKAIPESEEVASIGPGPVPRTSAALQWSLSAVLSDAGVRVSPAAHSPQLLDLQLPPLPPEPSSSTPATSTTTAWRSPQPFSSPMLLPAHQPPQLEQAVRSATPPPPTEPQSLRAARSGPLLSEHSSKRVTVRKVSVSEEQPGVSPALPAWANQGLGAGLYRVVRAIRSQARLWSWVRTQVQQQVNRMASNFWDGTDEDEGDASSRVGSSQGQGRQRQESSYETQILENSIQKIGALLAVGFGDAGAKVIAENIRNEGDINPMVPGRKTVAVFGFCDIRRFTDTTEVLQEEVMEFVNSIAHIVHTSCALHGGAANKNIGDAFLLVWKFPEGFTCTDLQEAVATTQQSQLTSTRFAGSSLVDVGQPGAQATGMELDACGCDGTAFIASTRQRMGSVPVLATSSGSPATRQGALGSMPPMRAAGGSALMTVAQSFKPRFLSLAAANQVVPVMSRGQRLGSAAGSTVTPPENSDDAAVRKVVALRSMNGQHESFSAEDKAGLVNVVADNALAAFVVVHAALRRSVRLARYAARADLAERLGANFRVQMGFGLHVGWAIEGAIGSEYKIDASYLSPNVNMASRLEAATKQFGVSMLLSGEFVDCLSPSVRAKVRQIDCVTVKGSTQPLRLFTYDIDLDGILEGDPNFPDAEADEEAFWAEYVTGWEDNDDLVRTWGASPAFIASFETGFQAYKRGDWQTARVLLAGTLHARVGHSGVATSDGPSQVLLDFMARHDFCAPHNWRGFRELTEK